MVTYSFSAMYRSSASLMIRDSDSPRRLATASARPHLSAGTRTARSGVGTLPCRLFALLALVVTGGAALAAHPNQETNVAVAGRLGGLRRGHASMMRPVYTGVKGFGEETCNECGNDLAADEYDLCTECLEAVER